MAEGPADADPFGLDDLDIADLTARPGTKWAHAGGRLAAWVADMDFPVAPAIRDRLIALARTDLGYPDWPAIARSPLPERFAARMATRFGWAPEVERLHEVADVMQGVALAIHHLTSPGDAIVLHMPAYHPFLETIAAAGRRILPVPAELVGGAWRFDHDRLAARLRTGIDDPARMLLLCHPHNPTGHVFTPDGARAAGRDRRPVTTWPWSATRSTPSSSIRLIATSRSRRSGTTSAARTVTVTSASKAFNLAGLRWAILHAGHDALQSALDALPPHYFGAPNLMGVAATEAAWSDGDDWQHAVAIRLDTNRKLPDSRSSPSGCPRSATRAGRDVPGVARLPPARARRRSRPRCCASEASS